MKTKYIFIFAVIAILIFSLASCGENDGVDTDTDIGSTDTFAGGISGGNAETHEINSIDPQGGELKAGKYRLSGDTVLESSIVITEDTEIDLAGRSLNAPHTSPAVIVKSGRLLISDSSNEKSGKIYNAETEYGGGLYISGGEVKFIGGSITENKAVLGGGVYVAGGKFILAGGTVENNLGTSGGGGIYVADGEVIIDGKVQYNQNGALGSGSGIYIAGGTVEMIENGLIYKNFSAPGGDIGCGIYLSGGTLDITGGEIRENYNGASYSYGGVYMMNGKLSISGGRIAGHTANCGGGAVIYGGEFTMTGGEITENYASNAYGGGGICIRGGNANISGGAIKNNSAFYSESGGGIAVHLGSLTISDMSILSGNKCSDGVSDIFVSPDAKVNGIN